MREAITPPLLTLKKNLDAPKGQFTLRVTLKWLARDLEPVGGFYVRHLRKPRVHAKPLRKLASAAAAHVLLSRLLFGASKSRGAYVKQDEDAHRRRGNAVDELHRSGHGEACVGSGTVAGVRACDRFGIGSLSGPSEKEILTRGNLLACIAGRNWSRVRAA